MTMTAGTVAHIIAENRWKMANHSANEKRALADATSGLRRIVRYLPDVAHEDLSSVISAIVAVANPITDPKVDTKTFTGDWYGGRVWLDFRQEQGQDGPHLNIYQVLFKGSLTVSDVVMTSNGEEEVQSTWYFWEKTLRALPNKGAGYYYTRGGLIVDDELGTYTYSIEKRTKLDTSIAMPAAVTDAGNVSKTPRTQTRTQVFEGATAAPTPLASDQYGEVSYTGPDAFGRYNGRKSITVYLSEFDIPGWALSSRTGYLLHVQRVPRNGYMRRRTIAFKIEAIQTGSAGTAFDHAHSNAALTGTEAGSSHYAPLANGQYKAIRITEYVGTIGSVSYPTAWAADGGAIG